MNGMPHSGLLPSGSGQVLHLCMLSIQLPLFYRSLSLDSSAALGLTLFASRFTRGGSATNELAENPRKRYQPPQRAVCKLFSLSHLLYEALWGVMRGYEGLWGLHETVMQCCATLSRQGLSCIIVDFSVSCNGSSFYPTWICCGDIFLSPAGRQRIYYPLAWFRGYLKYVLIFYLTQRHKPLASTLGG